MTITVREYDNMRSKFHAQIFEDEWLLKIAMQQGGYVQIRNGVRVLIVPKKKGDMYPIGRRALMNNTGPAGNLCIGRHALRRRSHEILPM